MTIASFPIRPVRPYEAEQLWSVFYRAVHQRALRDYSARQCAVWAPRQPDLAAWQARILNNQPFVLELNGQPVGFADLQDNGYIDQFFVDPDIRGRGIADALMGHLLKTAAERGLQSVYANVSLSAEAFFKRHGFGVVYRQRFMQAGTVFRNARMRRVMA